MPAFPFASALVTGASSGIGEEITRQLRAADVAVTLVARRRDRLEALAADLGDCEVLTADLETDEGQAAVAARIADTDRPVELVVNNAGFGVGGTFHELTVERLAAEIEVNVAALTRLSHAALAVMVPRRAGLAAQRVQRRRFPTGSAGRRVRRHEGLRDVADREPPRGGQGPRRHVTALCPGLTRHRVPAGQQHRRVPLVGTRLCLDQRRARSPPPACATW